MKIENKFMKALITGKPSFARSHLADFLIEKGYGKGLLACFGQRGARGSI